jgi:DNA-binding HxlR family transcriptional regulator
MGQDESAELVWWAVEIFRDRWFVLVLHKLLEGPKRQAELLREIDGISQRMLTRTLRHMERDGLVTRRTVRVKPLHVEYTPTETALSLTTVLRSALSWAKENQDLVERTRASWHGDRGGIGHERHAKTVSES